LNRRRFLKYAGGTVVVIGASALGLDYLLKPSTPGQTLTQATTSAPLEPPVIGTFQWQPTRVVNGKVYDAMISLDIQSVSPIAELSATLAAYAPTIPARAYPTEDLITLQFTTSAQSSDVATYSAEVANLRGGKQYSLNVEATNLAGNQTAQLLTPYVREFQNISGNDSLLVGAIYNPWFQNPCQEGWFCHWDELQADFTKGTTPLGTPLLGLYNSIDPMVIAKHIDWLTGYGIDFMLWDYWGQRAAEYRFTPFTQHPMIDEIKFALSYATQNLSNEGIKSVNLNDSSTYWRLQSDFEYIAKNYFLHPSYLKVNDRPVLQMYETFAIQTDIVKPLTQLRQHLKELGYEIYLIGDEISYGDRIDQKRLKVFDAISDANDYIPPTWNWNMTFSEIRNEYSRWRSSAHTAGVELVPFAYPGYDDSHLADRPKSYGYAPRSTQFLKQNLKTAMEFTDRNKMLGIVEFDGWGENTFEEPSVEDGFKYLQTIRDTLAGH